MDFAASCALIPTKTKTAEHASEQYSAVEFVVDRLSS
jgi:hypothetical protein